MKVCALAFGCYIKVIASDIANVSKKLERIIMKSIIYAAIAASVLASPTLSFAQEASSTVTRAQVRAELAVVVHAGYRSNDWIHYPESVQLAQQRVQAEHAAQTGQARESSP